MHIANNKTKEKNVCYIEGKKYGDNTRINTTCKHSESWSLGENKYDFKFCLEEDILQVCSTQL